ncbi:MAG TPA: crotonase/enoyl-CoA hydratase family protein, partial [Acidimicrobiales bacterium]|nr:crotonase/enoyl-CoA hydratase family protein [Acidimicrobiales bacterium]
AAVVTFTGRPGVFSGGFDLEALSAGGSEARTMVRAGFELAARLLDLPMPVVTVAPGHVIAMGAFLMMASDCRLGVSGPFRITCNEVKLGLTMPRPAIELCRPRLTPAPFYRSMTLSESFSPQEAVAAGFLDRIVPPARLDETAGDIVAALKELDLDAYRQTKQRVRGSVSQAVKDAIESDARSLALVLPRAEG